MARSATLDHIEKTLMEAYRKEIDQEENVWRSLPFFAATLALQLAALFPITDACRRALARPGGLPSHLPPSRASRR